MNFFNKRFNDNQASALLIAGAFVIITLLALSFSASKSKLSISPVTNNSLLPHRFLGTCISCHPITNIQPIAINKGTSQYIFLTPNEQMLVMNGQTVVVPTEEIKIQSPPVFTGQRLLPHTYQGLCSNCHVVLDAGFSDSYRNKAVKVARKDLVNLDTPNSRTAWGWVDRVDERRYNISVVLGWCALIFFIITSIYIAMRILLRIDNRFTGKSFKLKKWLNIHIWTAVIFFVFAMLHSHYSTKGNNYLHLALFILTCVFIEGIILRSRILKGKAQKNTRLVHSQQFLYYLLILLLIVGHWVGVGSF